MEIKVKVVGTVYSDSSLSLWRSGNHASREGKFQSQCTMIEVILWRGLSYKQTCHQYVHTENGAVRNSRRPAISRTLRFREVKLTTLNKALLERQPKPFEVFLSLLQSLVFLIITFCFNF